MARDSKLREVLDSLSGDPARSLPTQDRELMESVLRRLKIQEKRRLAQYEPPEPVPEEDLTEQELLALREQQQQDAEAMQRLQEERERLLAHQRELEDRLARLEAASHGGPLSYVDEPETVEFSRVDLPGQGDQDLLEFQYLGEGERDFSQPQEAAWQEEPAPHGEADWGEWPEESREQPDVQWDAGDDEAAAAHEEGAATPAPAWEEPGEPDWAETEQADWPETGQTDWQDDWDTQEPETGSPPWSETASEDIPADDEPESHEPAQAEAPEPGEDLENLDDRTRAELEELESQLAELEREIEKRDAKKGEEPEEEY